MKRARWEGPFQTSEILFENGDAVTQMIQEHIFFSAFGQSLLNFNAD
jgi:hypothetical protein